MISIKDVQYVFGYSYPTAKRFVESRGRMIDGKWFCPVDAATEAVAAQLRAATDASERLDEVLRGKVTEETA